MKMQKCPGETQTVADSEDQVEVHKAADLEDQAEVPNAADLEDPVVEDLIKEITGASNPEVATRTGEAVELSMVTEVVVRRTTHGSMIEEDQMN